MDKVQRAKAHTARIASLTDEQVREGLSKARLGEDQRRVLMANPRSYAAKLVAAKYI